MEVEQLFNSLGETGLVKALNSQSKLLFIGDFQVVKYLQTTLTSQENYYLFVEQWELLYSIVLQYKAVIIVSIQNEDSIYLSVMKSLQTKKIRIPVLRLFRDLFSNLMSGQELLKISDKNIQKPSLTYGVLTLPRSGSTFLCSVLQSTKIAGYPQEHLRQASLTLAENCNFNYLELLQKIMTYQVTPNGIFSSKLISHYLQDLQKTQFDFNLIFTLFDKFIYLVRKDKIAQAVSILLAEKTNIWHLSNKLQTINFQENLPKIYLDSLETIIIDDALLEQVHHKSYFINQQEAYCQQLIQNFNLSPLIIEYEQLLENLELQIAQILNYLNLKYPPIILKNLTCGVQKMTSKISQEICDRYQEKYPWNISNL